MRYNILVADPPFSFSDKLSMSRVKRSADANYPTLDMKAIKELKVPDIVADDAVLALWVPSSMLQDGLDIMKLWGFRQTQTFVWVKIKKNPFAELIKLFKKNNNILELLADFDLNSILAFGMGRLFRQTHEICLIGVHGSVYEHVLNKAQRSVCLAENFKHSTKPELLQDRLNEMFPDKKLKRIELFARRDRKDYVCVGLECPSTMGEDIRDSIERLKNM